MKKFVTLADQYEDENTWYRHCQTNNVPYIKVYPEGTFWSVDWDCITLDEADRYFSEPAFTKGVLEGIFAILATRKIDCPERTFWPYTYDIGNLSAALAELVAKDIYDLLLAAANDMARLETQQMAP